MPPSTDAHAGRVPPYGTYSSLITPRTSGRRSQRLALRAVNSRVGRGEPLGQYVRTRAFPERT